jgi:hypothetical protein
MHQEVPMSIRMLSLLRNRALRAQLAFAVAKVVTPIGLVAALLVAGTPRHGAPVAPTGVPVVTAGAPVATFGTPVATVGTPVASAGMPDAVRLP